jgi:retinol dehydrogenase 12
MTPALIGAIAAASFVALLIILWVLWYLIQGPMCTIKKDMTGQIVIVTGSNSGLGKETVKYLAPLGGTIIMACRDFNRTLPVIQEITKASGNQKIVFMKLDLGSLESVESFVEEFKSKYDKLDILVNNPGIMPNHFEKRYDFVEWQLMINHLGPFHLTNLLLERLLAAPEPRIINLSSIAHRSASLDLTDMNWVRRNYNAGQAYGNSKLCNIFHARVLAQRHGDKVFAASLHPGVVRTELFNEFKKKCCVKFFLCIFIVLVYFLLKSAARGAACQIYLCLQDQRRLRNGGYYTKNHLTSCTRLSQNMETAEEVWKISEKLIQEIKEKAGMVKMA